MNIAPTLPRAACFAVACFVLSFTTEVSAENGRARPVVRLTGSQKKVVPDRKARANAVSNQKNAAVVKKLNGVLQTLAKAELDDKGHCVAAMNEIGLAILHMTPQKPGSKLPNPAEVYTSNARTLGESQDVSKTRAASNATMHEGLKALNAIETHLAIMATTKEQIRADGSVKKAIAELNLALTAP